MSKSARIVIITAVIIAAAIILINPFHTKIKYTKFEVNKDPDTALQNSINNEKPVFLEFYASW